MKDRKGTTLFEIVIVVALISILCSIAFVNPMKLYHRAKLKAAALEIKEALKLSQQLSLNESKEYCVEVFKERYRVREYITGGIIVLSEKFDKTISVDRGSQNRIAYNRDGESKYGRFILTNNLGERIDIEVLIGVGSVRVSDIY
ncbi:hypothetical protein [Alkaliphilus oremlandii]|uniref:Prepilin-type N-terminal cleavage/methylation domain-containing protein n=1 Tax=Alkaliphilus oremlandii (strain OhILAs) TaxID=350688 RepID=A8MGE9_ALKOO|nr:hypothetical protein [Alkaliphilus oremlandii]ABW19172.1 hypothetical protein Clos_1629 [Alkaliphilus oremlandii OhILAs]